MFNNTFNNDTIFCVRLFLPLTIKSIFCVVDFEINHGLLLNYQQFMKLLTEADKAVLLPVGGAQCI